MLEYTVILVRKGKNLLILLIRFHIVTPLSLALIVSSVQTWGDFVKLCGRINLS